MDNRGVRQPQASMVAPSRDDRISDQLELIQNTAELMENIIDTLQAKLVPVMSPEGTEARGSVCPPIEAGLSYVVERLKNHNEKQQILIVRLQDILDRIRV